MVVAANMARAARPTAGKEARVGHSQHAARARGARAVVLALALAASAGVGCADRPRERAPAGTLGLAAHAQMQHVLLHAPLFGAAPRALLSRYTALSTLNDASALSADDFDALVAVLAAGGAAGSTSPAAAVGATLSALSQLVSLGASARGAVEGSASPSAPSAEQLERIIDAALILRPDERTALARARDGAADGHGASRAAPEALLLRRLALLGACVRSAAALHARVVSAPHAHAIAQLCLEVSSTAAGGGVARPLLAEAAADLLLQLCAHVLSLIHI